MYEFRCPQCDSLIYKAAGQGHSIGCPIRTCPHCNKDYNHPYVYEWSIISPLHKFYYCFLANGRWGFALWTFGELYSGHWRSSLVFGLIWIVFSILRLKLFDSENIKASYQRTKNNSEYIQKLSDLGCTSMDMRIDPFYKN